MTIVDESAYLNEIAIIDMTCRFPGAKNIDEFWHNLQNGIESVSFFSDEELLSAGIDPVLVADPSYVKAGAILEDISRFDAAFFGFSPKEAQILDPQNRLFLECASEILESAGYNSELYEGSIGIFAGKAASTYLSPYASQNVGLATPLDSFEIWLGNEKDFLASQISFKLNLKGPSINVQTACSTSLVAVHFACQSLLNRECDMALAGGSTIRLPQHEGYLFQEGGIYSPDGHCRAFDAKAQGTIWGNGVGIVLLKRLTDAIADGDNIYAVIKGSAVNNDGAAKAGYTAPSEEGQTEAILEALAVANVAPETISVVEAHGSGTSLGDPIEAAALINAFRTGTQEKGFCALGSVKTNLGHLDTAAGVASLIKTVLALKHKLIPPSLHFEQPNPYIDFTNTPFYVNTKLSKWEAGDTPRRAGVNALGIGGTNVHVILEEAPVFEAPARSGDSPQLLVISAKTQTALEQATKNLATHLREQPNKNLADVAYTLQVGRKAYDFRRMVLCENTAVAATALETLDPSRVFNSPSTSLERPITFMFPGLGDQYVNMTSQLYEEEPVFRQTVDYCCEVLQPYLNLDLRKVLYPKNSAKETSNGSSFRQMLGHTPHPPGAFEQISITQPALFVIEIALAQLWISWGIQPQAMIGYSLGEYVAACLAGVFSLEDGLRLIAQRAQIFEKMPQGAMLAVALSEEKANAFIDGIFSLAGINGPMMSVIAGPIESVSALEQELLAQDIACRQIQAPYAFHSKMMEPIEKPLIDLLQTIELTPPQIPYISNLTGTWITERQATDPHYWAMQLQKPVRFADGIKTIWNNSDTILLEVGIGQTLSSLAMQSSIRQEITNPIVLSSLPTTFDQKPDTAYLLQALGSLWLEGVPVDWPGYYNHKKRRRCHLPTYPFEHQSYWIDPHPTPQSLLPQPARTTPDAEKRGISDWFYIPSWERIPRSYQNSGPLKQHHWLIFTDSCELGTLVKERLQQQGQEVTAVTIGQSYQVIADDLYTINPHTKDDYVALIKHLYSLDKPPDQIVHMWNLTSNSNDPVHINKLLDTAHEMQQLGFYSLLYLAQALGNQLSLNPVHIHIISNNMQDVLGNEVTNPGKATLLGPLKVIPIEYEQITCSSVDLVLPAQMEHLLEPLLAELWAEDQDEIVAFRGQARWVQSFKSIDLNERHNGRVRLREEGVYLITGGFGGLGFALAKYLANTVRAKLVLLGRSPLPARATWSTLLSGDNTDEQIRRRIEQVQTLESLGVEVLALTADITDPLQMQQAVAEIQRQFGNVNGVFHTAGVPGEGLIQFKTAAAAAKVLAPKLQGTLILNHVLQEDEVDFMVLYSSMSAITGGLGEVDYCAANAFLDSFAYHNCAQGSIPTISINWGAWQWDAWQSALARAFPKIHKQMVETRQIYGFSFAEGLEALSRILSTRLSQVVVSARDLKAIDTKQNLLTSFDLMAQTNQAQNQKRYPRPDLRTAYVPPRDEVEKKIAEIWAEALAIEKVGIHDQFLELGGNSLLGLAIVASLQEMFDVKLSAAILYEGPTVSTLRDLILPEKDEKPAIAADVARGKRRNELQRKRRRKRNV